ncbi:S8 family peptidase [Patescibacteria group bacterium]
MKKLLTFLFSIFVLFIGTIVVLKHNQVSAENQKDYVKNEILVKFKEGVSSAEVNKTHKDLGGKAKKTIPGINVQVVTVEKDVGKSISAYAKNRNIDYVEPNFYAHALQIPNDSYFTNQWGFNNTGQECCNTAGDICTTGTVDADIDAPEAWNISIGNNAVLVAILDSGIDQDHEDLQAKIISNINFTDSSTYDDIYGHGTHVSGIAAAMTNNNLGVAGMAHQANLMNVKVLNDVGYGAYSWIADGIIWATNNGAKVINMSLGGNRKSDTLKIAVDYAWDNGVLLVAAAGNSGNPSKTYPGYYENCIAVAATDNHDNKASFSSYGSWVDVAAPGENVYSTFPNHPFYLQTQYGRSNNYDFGNGTSMSSPFVAGIAVLVWNTDLGLDNQEVRNKIEQEADPITGTGSYWTWGRVNACNSVGGDCKDPSPSPEPSLSPSPSPEPSLSPSPSPEPNQCLNCFKGVCNGVCHPVKEDSSCPDCL